MGISPIWTWTLAVYLYDSGICERKLVCWAWPTKTHPCSARNVLLGTASQSYSDLKYRFNKGLKTLSKPCQMLFFIAVTVTKLTKPLWTLISLDVCGESLVTLLFCVCYTKCPVSQERVASFIGASNQFLVHVAVSNCPYPHHCNTQLPAAWKLSLSTLPFPYRWLGNRVLPCASKGFKALHEFLGKQERYVHERCRQKWCTNAVQGDVQVMQWCISLDNHNGWRMMLMLLVLHPGPYTYRERERQKDWMLLLDIVWVASLQDGLRQAHQCWCLRLSQGCLRVF